MIFSLICRFFTTEEILSILEERDDVTSADVFIFPPDDGDNTEEDSGDEEGGTPNNLSGKQLSAIAELRVTTMEGKENLVEVDEINPEHSSSSTASTLDVQQKSKKLKRSEPKPSTNLTNKIQQKSKMLKKTDSKLSTSNAGNKTDVEQSKKLKNFEWKKVDIQPTFQLFMESTETSIPNDAVECFELFFDDEVFDHLVNMFIIYATQTGDHAFETTTNEVKCYIAILILSGYISVPRWRMLWEVGTESYNEFVSCAMRRNRFELLKKYTHCANNTSLEKGNRFAKLSPLINLLNEKFLKNAKLVEKLSVDESMVPYYGKHGAKQFIKGKPIRFGYKMWCICEPLGYLIQFYPYAGKDLERPKDVGLGEHVVMTLVEKLPPAPYKIYADRFFSTINLAARLKENGMGYTGTIMSNRIGKCPIPSKSYIEKQARGYYDYSTEINSGCLIMVWNDNKAVHAISTCDSIQPVAKVKRWSQKDKKKIVVPQPNAITCYNKSMGGIDRMDENISYYRVSLRSKKWWWPIFVFCIDAALQNAWQLFKKRSDNEELDHLAFRRRIVQTYLQKYGTPVSSGIRPKTSKELAKRTLASIRFDCIDHWMVDSPKQNRCAVCKKNARKYCEKCKITLHVQCFKSYHKP